MSRMAGMGEMDMPGMLMPMKRFWDAGDFALGFAMWAVMMAAMMTPSAAPTVLLFAKVQRTRAARDDPAVPTFVFLAGYLAVWTAFSLAATAAQAGLHAAALLSPDMAWASPRAGGAVLAAAGAFQFTPWKRACLAHCRAPLDFLMTGWREGAAGALAMGARHGAYCAGCCWALMALLFVLGAMNLLWVAAVSALVLAEKAAPRGERIARAAGAALLLWGAWAAANAP